MEEYLQKGGKKLRLGYTTGSCAALAAGAAAEMLFSGKRLSEAQLTTPKGLALCRPLHEVWRTGTAAGCAVQKDAGDDPDITDGILVHARAERCAEPGVHIEGGEGVGRVTRKGLDQPPGKAAINTVPRQMITRQVEAAADAHGYEGGVRVVISIPGGEALAKKTFNPHLGIVGGLSVIGTSGIVEPMSEQALLDTIETELKMHRAEGRQEILLTPGNYGETFLKNTPALQESPVVKCSNFVGDALDMALRHGFSRILLVGHAGKLVKLAGGVMNTHSSVADARLELLALHAMLAGAGTPLAERLLAAATTEAAFALLGEAGLLRPTAQLLLARAESYLVRRTRGQAETGVIMFTNQNGLLGFSPGAEQLLQNWGQH